MRQHDITIPSISVAQPLFYFFFFIVGVCTRRIISVFCFLFELWVVMGCYGFAEGMKAKASNLSACQIDLEAVQGVTGVQVIRKPREKRKRGKE